jgi:hypothetical protein
MCEMLGLGLVEVEVGLDDYGRPDVIEREI